MQQTEHLPTIAKSSYKNIICHVSQSQNLLDQYYLLREKCYTKDLNLQHFSGAEENYDKLGKIVIAEINGKVIGGARIVISTPNKPIQLPLEGDNFVMKDLFPEFQLENKTYLEIGRVAIDPAYRNGYINYLLNKEILMIARSINCFCYFSVSTLLIAKNNTKVANKLAIRHLVLKSIKVPKKGIYENLNYKGMYLSVTLI